MCWRLSDESFIHITGFAGHAGFVFWNPLAYQQGQDQIRLPGMLMEKLSYLASTVAIADFKPADQYVEVYQELHTEWIAVEKAWNQFKKEEVAAFQNTMKSASAGPLIMSSEE